VCLPNSTDNLYYNVPVLAAIEADKFVGTFLNLYPSNQREATSIVNSTLPLSAVTVVESGAKYDLQVLKLKLNALPRREEPNQIGVPLKKDGGTFVVPVQVNGAITLDFTIDSGAADVTVPADVFSTLTRTGTVTDADIT
jgi:predicted aspartyl protease